MFIIDVVKKEDATGELKALYEMIEKSLGFVPPHFELFATLDLKAMKEFVQYNQYLMMHEKIDKNILPHLRLEIAKRECRGYCVAFNTNMLEKMGATSKVAFDECQALLMQKVLKSIYETAIFNKDDLEELYSVGFSDKDFFDLLSYSSNFMAKSKMIEVYLKEKN